MRISDWSSDVCSSDLRERNDEISQTKCVVLARKRFMAVAGRADRGADRPDPALDLTQGGAPARRSSCSFAQEAMMQIVQPRLPYSYSALEPYVSRSTLQLHYGKHHRAYVEKTKALAKQLRLADTPLEKIIAQI